MVAATAAEVFMAAVVSAAVAVVASAAVTTAAACAAAALPIAVAAIAPRISTAAAVIATAASATAAPVTPITGRSSTGGIFIAASMRTGYYAYPRYYHRCRIVWTYYGPRKICRYPHWRRHYYGRYW